MFIELTDKNNLFYKKYIRSFAARSAVSSVNLEEDEENFESNIAINSYLEAYDIMFEKFNSLDICYTDLPAIISILTDGEYTDFRKINVSVNGSNFERTKPYLIRQELYLLFKEYDELKNIISNPYLLEAIFHIKFLKIHPFGDGNGRCARIISCLHLCKKDLAPFCIPRHLKGKYCEYIENNDYDSLAIMFEKLSLDELNVMLNIYKKCDFIEYKK